jgi:hypothetical protein
MTPGTSRGRRRRCIPFRPRGPEPLRQASHGECDNEKLDRILFHEAHTVTGYRDEVTMILDEMRGAYEEFLVATTGLRSALESDEAPEANTFIERREVLIRTIDDLDRRVRKLRLPTSPDQNPTATHHRATMARAIGEKLKAIISVNQQCDALAANGRERARQDLMRTRQQGAGLHGYAPKRQRSPRFLNVQT